MEQIRRLSEEDHVDFTFQTLGTPTNSAIAEYLNHKKVPMLFVGSGASLRQCNGDFSRTNVMDQAEGLHNFEVPVLLPGIKVNTTHTDHRPITPMQFMKWDGKTWVRFGDLLSGATV